MFFRTFFEGFGVDLTGGFLCSIIINSKVTPCLNSKPIGQIASDCGFSDHESITWCLPKEQWPVTNIFYPVTEGLFGPENWTIQRTASGGSGLLVGPGLRLPSGLDLAFGFLGDARCSGTNFFRDA